MSHSRQRKDKVCLNCNVEIYGRYCHNCGQENIEPKETAWGLVTHFLYDITHFDGKFFSTVKYLLLRPGFLSNEYIRGRRASYLHPIRMYVFTSAFFFIVFFSLFKVNKLDLNLNSRMSGDSLKNALIQGEAMALKEARTKTDSERIRIVIRQIKASDFNKVKTADTASELKPKTRISVEGVKYESVAAYNAAQKRLPAGKRDGWYKRTKTEKLIAFKQGMQEDPDEFMGKWFDKIMHSFPQLLFISLPLFTLLLKLLYIRRKQFYYGDHAIFTIHLYIFTFISLFILLMLNQLHDRVDWSWIRYLQLGVFLYIIYYSYRAMKIFYEQGSLKTFLKFCLLNTMSYFMILVLFLAFVILSIYEI